MKKRASMRVPGAAPAFTSKSSLRAWVRGMITLILAAFCAAPSTAGEPSIYTLDLTVLTVPAIAGEPMKVIGPDASASEERRNDPHATTWSGVREVRFGGLTLTLKADSLRWNGDPVPPAGTGIQQLIDRQVRLHAGQPTQIRALVDNLQYFEQVEGGLFKLKSVSKKDLPGLLLKCEVEGSRTVPGAGRLIIFDYDLRMVVVEGHEELPGAPGQKGKPQLARFDLERTEELPAGAWHLVSGHLVSDTSSSRGTWLLILIRITPLEE